MCTEDISVPSLTNGFGYTSTTTRDEGCVSWNSLICDLGDVAVALFDRVPISKPFVYVFWFWRFYGAFCFLVNFFLKIVKSAADFLNFD